MLTKEPTIRLSGLLVAIAYSLYGAVTIVAAALSPAKTPTDAMKQWWQAIADGDQKAYADCVIVRSQTGYCEAFANCRFASYRLHDIVSAKRVSSDDGKGGRLHLSSGIAPPAPTAQIMPNMMTDIEKVQWTVNGTSATPVYSALTTNEWGSLSAERVGDRWVIVVSDPDKLANKPNLERYVTEFKATTIAIHEATTNVQSGTFTSVRQINEYLESKFADAKAKEKP